MTRFAVRYWSAALAAILSSPAANADYFISVVDSRTGQSAASAHPGDTLKLGLLLTGSDPFDSFGVSVEATPNVLNYGEHVIAPGRLNPSGGPLFISCGGPVDDIECEGPYMTGLTEVANTFWDGDGYLAILDATISDAAVAASTITIQPMIDFFSSGFDDIGVMPGSPLVLTIVPEPLALELLAFAGLLLLIRRA